MSRGQARWTPGRGTMAPTAGTRSSKGRQGLSGRLAHTEVLACSRYAYDGLLLGQ